MIITQSKFCLDRGRGKIDELAEQLEMAKLNFQQLGGVLEEDEKKMKEENEEKRWARQIL